MTFVMVVYVWPITAGVEATANTIAIMIRTVVNRKENHFKETSSIEYNTLQHYLWIITILK